MRVSRWVDDKPRCREHTDEEGSTTTTDSSESSAPGSSQSSGIPHADEPASLAFIAEEDIEDPWDEAKLLSRALEDLDAEDAAELHDCRRHFL